MAEALGTGKGKLRAVETNALVDTGAVKFYLKPSIIQELGLRPAGEISMRTMPDRSESRIVFSRSRWRFRYARGDLKLWKFPIHCRTSSARFRWKIWTGWSIAKTRS